MLYSHLHHHSASQRHNIKDRRINKRRMMKTLEERTQEWRTHDKDAIRKTQEDFFNNILPLTLFVRVRKGCSNFHVRGCWRPNINFIFWPHCYDRHVVSCSPDVGVNSIGGFPRAPSVGCGLPYHIWSLLSGSLLATALALNSTQLYDNSTPTRSPTGSLKSNV